MALDPYHELGVERGATQAEINAAWRRVRTRTHPDKNPDDPHAATRFALKKEAYEILSDPRRRSDYDTGGSGKAFRLDELARQALVETFFEIAFGGNPHQIIAALKDQLKRKRYDLRKQVAQARDAAAKTRRLADSFEYLGDGDNWLADAIDAQASKIESEVREIEQKIEVATAAIALAEAYADAEPAELFLSFGGQASTVFVDSGLGGTGST